MMVTDESKTAILPMTCAALISQLDDADYMISRFKSENFIISYLLNDEENPLTRKLHFTNEELLAWYPVFCS